MMRSTLGLLLASCLALGCSSDGGGDDGNPTGDVTYYQNVKPILDAKCNGCHLDGGIAPFALGSYEQAREVAAAMKLNVEAGLMPPWPPDDGCAEYFGDRSLSQEQIDTISAWVDQGTPEGDPNNPGAPLDVEEVRLSRVDKTLSMPEEYTAQLQPDDYRCFVIPWDETTTKYITGFNAVPGNSEVVHHVIAFLAGPGARQEYENLDAGEAGPGYTCFGGTGGSANAWIGAWAPGGQGGDFPPGTGMRVEPGSTIVLQVHYNTLSGGAQPDKTSIQVSMEDTVEREGVILPWANPQWLQGGMSIPAHEKNVMHSFAADPSPFLSFITDGAIANNEPFVIHSAALHMHNLGTRATTSIRRAGGAEECMVTISNWDFNWQDSYGLRQPKVFNPGDQIYLECHWDNSAENQPVYNGDQLEPQNVNWGDGTTDEMCLGVFYITPVQ